MVHKLLKKVFNWTRALNNQIYTKQLQHLLNLPSNSEVNFDKLVSIVCCTNKPQNITNILTNFFQQTYTNKELIIVLHMDFMVASPYLSMLNNKQNVKVFLLGSDITLGECLNFGISKTSGCYVSKWDCDDFYGACYIQDMTVYAQSMNADILGKRCHYIYFKGKNILTLRARHLEHKYTLVIGATLFIKKSVFLKVQFEHLNIGEDRCFQRRCIAQGFRIYSTDPFNYLTKRDPDQVNHTWKINEKKFLASCKRICDKLELNFINA
jgi:hypothetical protein